MAVEAMLLCAHMEPGRVMRLSMIALSLGFGFKVIEPREYDVPLGALCGDQDAPNKPLPPMPVDAEMIVMASLSDSQVDALLKALRESGLAPIPFKAVLTETNRHWSFGMLCRELKTEHARLSKT